MCSARQTHFVENPYNAIEKIYFLHDNSRVFTANLLKDTHLIFDWEMLVHTSLDIFPSTSTLLVASVKSVQMGEVMVPLTI